jgi:twitching motility protein PilU
MEKSGEQGMQTFDMALFNLYKSGQITIEEALKNADSKNNLRLRVTLDGKKPQEKAEKETSQAAPPKPPPAKFNVAEEKPAKEEAPAEGMEGLSLLSIEEEENPTD